MSFFQNKNNKNFGDDLRNLSAPEGCVVVADVVHGPWLQHELGLALGQLGLQ